MAIGTEQARKSREKRAEAMLTAVNSVEYAPGQFYDKRTTVLGGSYDDLYNSTGVLTNKQTGEQTKVNVDQSKINLTAEQQLAIKNNKNFKETQKRLQSAGVNSQQSILGGGGY